MYHQTTESEQGANQWVARTLRIRQCWNTWHAHGRPLGASTSISLATAFQYPTANSLDIPISTSLPVKVASQTSFANPSRLIIFFQYDMSLLFVLIKLTLRSSGVPWCTPSPRLPNHSLMPLLYPWMLVTRRGRRADHTNSALHLRVLKGNPDFLIVFRSENLFECLLARKTNRGSGASQSPCCSRQTRRCYATCSKH
jgi:hypothetical protein